MYVWMKAIAAFFAILIALTGCGGGSGGAVGVDSSTSSDVGSGGNTGSEPSQEISDPPAQIAWQPQGNTLYAAWVSPDSQVFAVGERGIIVHYDGVAWTTMNSGFSSTLNSVWGSSATDVYAVGARGTILHFDGSAWSQVPSGVYADLTGVWGSASDDVFVVGNEMLHFDGDGWSQMHVPGAPFSFIGVWGASAADVYAIGNRSGSQGLIFHYDGLAWSEIYNEESRGERFDPLGIWGSSGNDIFVVGISYPPGLDPAGAVLHFDGNTWSLSPLIDVVPNTRLFGVWGDSPEDVFAVGDNSGIIHYDGSTWTRSPVERQANFSGISGNAAGSLYAVGEGGRIFRFDGISWRLLHAANPYDSSIGVESPQDSGNPSLEIAWQWQNPLPQGNTLHGVWAGPDNHVFAVGDLGTIVHYDGSTWTTMQSGSSVKLTGVWGSSATDVYAVGYPRTILHYDGNTWAPITSGPYPGTHLVYGGQFSAVWGSSSSNVFVVGDGNPQIFHFDGATWTDMRFPARITFRGVWGSATNNVYAVGSQDGYPAKGVIYHYDGRAWRTLI